MKKVLFALSFLLCSPFLSGCSFSIPIVSVQDQAKQLVEHLGVEQGSGRVYLVAWQAGKKVASWHTKRENMQASLERAATKIQEQLDEKQLSGGVDLHLHYLKESSPFDREMFVLGQDSIGLTKADRNQVRYYGSYAFEHNYDLEKLEEKLCKKAGLTFGCFTDPSLQVRLAKTSHVGFVEGDIVNFGYGNDLDSNVTKEDISFSVSHAQEWLANNLLPDGTLNYLYMPSRGEYSTNNNMIRQLMGSRVLADRCSKNGIYCNEHRRNLSAIFDLWYQESDGEGYVLWKNKSKLGANALLLRVLVASPYMDEYNKQTEALLAGIKSLIASDGFFRAWYVEPDYEYDEDYLLTFYSGEAIIALTEYAQRTNDDSLRSTAESIQKKYIQRYVKDIEKWYYPAYVPRHTMSLYNLYAYTGDPLYKEAIYLLNNKVIDEMLHTDIASPGLMGRFYNDFFPQYGTPHSASDGVYLEGLVYAYLLAQQEGDMEQSKKYANAIGLASKNLIRLQYTQEKSYFMQYPDRVMGAIRFRIDDNRIRVDTTQHMIDAFDMILETDLFELHQ